MRYWFFKAMTLLDNLCHVTDKWPLLDFISNSDWRYDFCQWVWCNFWEEEEKR